MNNDEIVALVRREVDAAMGYDSDVLATKREKALQYYHGFSVPAPEGRSNIVSKDVADVVHSLLAQVGPMFQSSIIQFEPEAEDDEPQAQLESDYVRYTLERSDGYKILSEAAHDALLVGNGWIKVEVEERVDVTEEQYPALDPLQLMQVEQPTAQEQEVKVTETDDGYRVKRETTTRELKVESISPDVMLFSNASDQFQFQELRFVGERKLYTMSDLLEMGVSRNDIESIPESEDDYWPAIRARDGIYQDDTSEYGAYQEAERLRECFDCYFRIDLEENGTSELRHIIYGGSVLISNEPADCIPYATGSPVPMPHRIAGSGMFELMAGIQDAKTHTLRQYMDNLAVMNSSRVAAVEGQCNMEDLTNGRINGVVRVRSPDAVIPLPAADVGNQAITGLNYLDTVREQRGGASLDLNDADRQLMSSSATAAAGAIAGHEKMAGWYCHNLVNTLLKNAYLLIHKKLRYDMQGQMQAKLRGKWVQTDTSDWQERKHIEVMAGMTTTERNNQVMGLTQLISHQEQLISAGYEGVITDKGKVYNALADWIRATELGQPEEYFIDPDSEESQAAQQSKAQQQQQMQQMQQQVMQMQQQMEQQKLQLDKYKIDQELKYKYYDTNVDAGLKEAELTSDGVIEMEKLNAEDQRTAVQQQGIGSAN